MTDQPGYIVIPNWDSFQHYKDRAPTWIKVYTELLDKDEYLNLSFAQRGILHGVWLLVARSGQGRVPLKYLSRLLQGHLKGDMRHFQSNLESLIQAGFIEVSASKMLAQREKGSKEPKKENARADEQAPAGLAAHAENGHTNGVPPVAPIPPEWAAAIKQMEEDEARYGS